MENWLVLSAAVAILIAGCSGNGAVEPADEPSEAGAAIEVRVTGLRSDEGQVLVSLFASPEGFPSSHEKALRHQIAEPDQGSCTVVFEDVPTAPYAVSVLHDENGNSKLDTGLFGVPKEGYGVSMNPKPGMGPPSYDDAMFALEGDRRSLEIKVMYLTGKGSGQ